MFIKSYFEFIKELFKKPENSSVDLNSWEKMNDFLGIIETQDLEFKPGLREDINEQSANIDFEIMSINKSIDLLFKNILNSSDNGR